MRHTKNHMLHDGLQKRPGAITGNEDGTAIIAALLVLMLLTLVALTATNTTLTEKAVVRSEAVFDKTFYLSESAAMEGVQRFDDENDRSELLVSELTPSSKNATLLRGTGDEEDPDNDLSNLDGNTAAGGNNDGVVDGNDFGENANIDTTNTYRAVVLTRTSGGQSLKVGQSRLYDYYSYGFTDSGNGRSLIKIGFKKRFK